MSNYSAENVEKAIEGLEDGPDDNYFENWGEIKCSSDGWVVCKIDIDGDKNVPVTKIAGYGGEGKGDEIWVVVSVGTQLFRKDGYYSSGYGSDWDGDLYEVVAREVTVTVYE